jgi:vacuolar iron transporter family protein
MFSDRPIQAASTSAASFAVGALMPLLAMPLLAVAVVPDSADIIVVSATSPLFLAILGGVAAHVGGARVSVGAVRVTFWGALGVCELCCGDAWPVFRSS